LEVLFKGEGVECRSFHYRAKLAGDLCRWEHQATARGLF
jgi:hypothetical protein